MTEDPRIAALPDIHGHAKGEHKPFAEERPIPYTARMLFLWFYHACRRGSPRFLMVADHMNYLTFEDPAAVNLVRRALKLAQAGDLYGAAETAGVDLGHAQIVSEGLRKGIRYSIGAEVDNDPRCRPDAQNIVDAMRPDGMIRSVHFLPIAHPQHGENWMWPFDNPEFAEFFESIGTERVWEIYMATLLEAIEKLPGHIVAHFYVPAKFGHWPDDAVLDAYEDQLLDACAERGMAVEVNSRYIYKFYAGDEAQLERFRSAHLRLLRKAKAKGVAVAVGSDAHSPKDQGRAFDAVLALLDEAEINEIAFPINGRLARVALRATEEILRQASAAVAPPPPEPVTASTNGSATPVADTRTPAAAGAGPAGGAQQAAHAGDLGPGADSDSDPDSEASTGESAGPVVAAKTARKRPPRKRTSRAAAPAPSNDELAQAGEAAASPAVTPFPEAEPAADESSAPEPRVAVMPVAEAPVAETPVAEAPVAEAPVAEVPVAEVPAAEMPAVAIPVADIADGKQAEPVAAETVAAETLDAETPVAASAPGTADAGSVDDGSTPTLPVEAAVALEAADREPEAAEAASVEVVTAAEPVAGPLTPPADVAKRPKAKPRPSPRTRAVPARTTPSVPAPAKPAATAAKPVAAPAKPAGAPAKPAAKVAPKSAAAKSRPAQAVALKPVAKKAAASKPAAKKATPKTAASKKSSPRPAAKPAKKAPAKKAAGARPSSPKTAKKAPAKRAAPAKKPTAKKAVKKKTARPRR